MMQVIITLFMATEYRSPFRRAKQRLRDLLVAGLWVAAAADGLASTLTVTSVNDSGVGSLRQAILNANDNPGLDTIVFQIPGTGLHTIVMLAALPTIADAVVIDGTTQPGYSNKPVIELNGANLASVDGLRLSAGGSTIRGLTINRCGGTGIHVQAPGGTNFIEGNFIGTDATGTLAQGNGQSAASSGGLWIDGSSGNWIGGADPTNRNLISGNSGPGVFLQNCTGNTVQGNIIGTSVSGTAALGNSNNGITLYNAPGNLVGGTAAATRNLISGNGGSGVYLIGSTTTGNLVQGNYVGTDTNGTAAIANAGDGVTVNGAAGNTIGGTNAGAGNLLSGNRQGGVGLKNAGANGNLVQGNFIGTTASGKLALPNLLSGTTIFGGNNNLIGGTTAAARNIISANKLSGLFITTNSVGNLVQGNFIGVDVTGTNALGNTMDGISIDSASSNTIGGTTADARNIISGNSNGIEIYNATATGNSVLGNYIGPSLSGQSALGNRLCGLRILSSGNTVGGSAEGAGNLISGNGQDGILLEGPSAANNVVQGNFIGTAASGTSALGNGRAGVNVSGAPRNTIGGTTAGAGNLLSANGDAGIDLLASGATGNLILGNKIGTDVTGTLALGNTYEGIYAAGAASNTIGGAVLGAGNLVSGNRTRGIWLTNASWNVIQGNLIGTMIDGISRLANTYHGVECEAGAGNTTIGGNEAAGNRIAFASGIYAGVRIRDRSTNNAILGNAIFSNGALGIDLSSTVGVNPNIPCNTGSGANMAQNYPILAQAVSGAGTGVRGTLNSRPNRAFLLQFFANPACDSTGYGEGQVYLGQTTVVTGNNCNVGFVANLPGSIPVGYFVTATATDSANNTSEFSACVPVGPAPALKIGPTTNQQVNIAWANTTTGFVLNQTESLSPPIQWTTVTNSPVVTNGQFVVTLSTTTGSRFYVLRFE